MKSENIYSKWKERKKQIDVPVNFADKVMGQVYSYERSEQQTFIEVLLDYSLVKAGFIISGAVAGVARLVFMIVMILSKGEING